MKLFVIPKGTKALIHRYTGSLHYDTQEFSTTKENVFDLEEVSIDPVGGVGAHRGLPKTIGGHFAKQGYYGFTRGKWTLIIPATEVKIL